MSNRDGWIGRSVKRREDPRLIQGQGRYAGDHNPPSTLHLAIRRGGVPHARIVGIDVSRAAAMPGVADVYTFGQLGLADDYMPDPNPQQPLPVRRPVLAKGEVRFEGDAVAVVAAESAYEAQDAADAIAVELEELGPVGGSLPQQHFAKGDAVAAIERSPVRVRQRLRMARVEGAAMEPRAAFAEWNEDDQRLTIRASVGGVHILKDAIARCLGLDGSHVVALVEDVGGSFGAKNHPYPEYVLVAAVARLHRRPVRWVASRIEDGGTTGQAHGAELDVELGADEDGKLSGFRCSLGWPAGGYVSFGAFQVANMALHGMSAYRMPAYAFDVAPHASATPPAAFIRGGGRPVGNFAIERAMDRLARMLKVDPIELRRRNLVRPDEMPYTTGLAAIVYDGGDYPRLLELATERAGVDEIRERQRRGEPVGMGVAMCIESTGIGNPEPSRVVISGDGIAIAYVGSTPQGQGHETFVAQVVADRLGWPIERIEVRAGDSRGVPFSFVTAASRSAVEVGNSVAMSATAARQTLLQRAADILEAAPDDLVVSPDGVEVRGSPARKVSLAKAVGDGIEAAETWNSNGRSAWASSCHCAVVRIDEDTGSVDMLRYVIAHDSGRPINPMMLEGQLHGGYAHGLGYALFEEAVYGADANFQSASFLDYTIVSAPEIRVEPELIHTETETSHNPEGFRGAGEAGTIAVPAAVANAIEDALFARGYDSVVDEIPVTPLRLWNLVRSASRRAPS